ncbi:shikimate kinase [Flavobacterium terrigena]|uniref:Shikimate kinase n=1 Tax=Flavobacterium terrigena TaxID=402734 RepID=A0A1H6QPG2_9FLAO|nr:shikimate kinase [Flavobacterium terrigena]SEI45509.1 shikimate kinase [Flavobacterium terrigena]
MKIILVGYMASGKSTIGKLLSESLNVSFYDLDHLIETDMNLKVNEIFEQKGELSFRKKEREVLTNFLNTADNYVLALGGGTPCYYDNFELYQSEGIHSIYLKASVETILKRLHTQKASRPLVARFNEEELQEFVAKHLFERNYFYHQVKTIVSIDEKDEKEIVSEIVSKLT